MLDPLGLPCLDLKKVRTSYGMSDEIAAIAIINVVNGSCLSQQLWYSNSKSDSEELC